MFPTKLHINSIRVEFERVSFELKRYFVTWDLLVVKRKLSCHMAVRLSINP